MKKNIHLLKQQTDVKLVLDHLDVLVLGFFPHFSTRRHLANAKLIAHQVQCLNALNDSIGCSTKIET